MEVSRSRGTYPAFTCTPHSDSREIEEPTGVVVVVHERTESINISESLFLLLICSSDLVHGLTGTKHVVEGKEHWVVEKSFDWTLISTDEVDVTIEALSHLEDT